MIGYEPEFFVMDKKTYDPISRKQFELFHKSLQADGWTNIYDPVTNGLIYSRKGGIYLKTDDAIHIFEANLPPKDTLVEADREIRDFFSYVNLKLGTVGCQILYVGAYPKKITNAREDFVTMQNYISLRAPRFQKYGHVMDINAGNHCWLDVARNKLIEQANFFSSISGIIIALFECSAVSEGKISNVVGQREVDLRNFGITEFEYDKNMCGIPEKPFESLLDYLDYLMKINFFLLYLPDGTAFALEDKQRTFYDYFRFQKHEVVRSDGKRFETFPTTYQLYRLQNNTFLDVRPRFKINNSVNVPDVLEALDSKDEEKLISYVYQSFLEVRCIASQGASVYSCPPAFLLGLQANMAEAEELVARHTYGYWKRLREKAIERGLDFEFEGRHITEIASEFISASEKGLKKRGFGEEGLLAHAKKYVSAKENPGQRKLRLYKEGGLEKLIQDSLS